VKHRILFVDDDPNVLSGLRRMLRPFREQWEMEFAANGPAALEALCAGAPFDVIVSDMRMPGMDGAELLTRVRERWPGILRFVLSGQTDQELALRASGPAHQFLSKPCDGQLLIATIQRALGVRDTLSTSSLAALVSQLDKLPSLPSTYRRLVEEVNSPEISVDAIGRIIGQDPAMTVKILKLVNSSFFSFNQHVTSPVQATLILGVNTIKSLVLGVQVFSQLETDIIEELHLADLQTHSLAVAMFARRLAEFEQVGREAADEAFLAGLLHDVGKLVLAANLPDRYRQTILAARQREIPLHQMEKETLGATHAEIGAYLLALWGFPVSVTEAVGFHHGGELSAPTAFSPFIAVHAADCFEHEDRGSGAAHKAIVLDLGLLERAGCGQRVQQWRAACSRSPVAGGVE
jgi:putative nucleotidyltransferase with HDIG domain